ncbi:MAG: PaaI family thioesterase [Bacteroidota bacterium]
MNIDFQTFGKDFLPGLIGVEIESVEHGAAKGHLQIRPDHLAPNGYLHAGTVVSLADTLAGYGCVGSLPEGATSFTTVELKTNFTGTARNGRISAEASMVHGGRTTQLWDVSVYNETGKKIALFRCTQFILYPKQEQ